MKKILFLTVSFLIQSVFAQFQTTNMLPPYVKVAVEKELISAYTYQWADKKLVMTKENILSMEYASEEIPSCEISVTGLANKPTYEGSSTYQYFVCVALGADGIKAALINDNLIAEE